MPGGDGGGSIKDGGVAEATCDLGCCGRAFLITNQLHFFIGEAVEIDQHLCGAAYCGEGGGLDLPFKYILHALGHLFDGAAQAFGYAFVCPGGG